MKRSVSSSIEDQNAKIALSLSFKTIWLTVPSSNKDKETAAPPANGSIKVPVCADYIQVWPGAKGSASSQTPVKPRLD